MWKGDGKPVVNDDSAPENLWKVTLHPGGAERSAELAFDFCRNRGIVGIGWGLPEEPRSKHEAKRLTREYFNRLPGPVNALVTRMNEGDHAWVYGDSKFWVCKIESDWRYAGHSDPWEKCDIHHFREATWKEVPAPLVPGVVKRNLFQQGTAHQMKKGVGDATRMVSGWLFETENLDEALERTIPYGELGKQLEGMAVHRILQMLAPDEVEDLAGMWVQDQGWHMLKSSAYRQKRMWECEFTRGGQNGPETAYMQVKSGNTSLAARPYVEHLEDGEWLFLFSTALNPYPDQEDVNSDRIVFVKPEELVKFLAANLKEVPGPIGIKLALAADLIT